MSDLSDGVSSNVILLADDTILYSCVERQEDCHALRENAKWYTLDRHNNK